METNKQKKERETKEKTVSFTGEAKTTIRSDKKQAGRVKKTDAEFDQDFNTYLNRIEKRISFGEEIKILDRDAWNKSKPSGETSQEIFTRLTKSRMPKMLKSFNNISALAKYTHVDAQGEKIVNDLLKSVEMVKIAFSAKPENKEVEEDYQI